MTPAPPDPPELQDEAVKTVRAQAELLRAGWNETASRSKF
jgi:hypothetical protein